MDEVRYHDQPPWPVAADGSGPSLQRRNPGAYGNDPLNWQAAAATPGADFVPTGPPTILEPPQDQIVAAGVTVVFTVHASGPPPLNYQWRGAGGLLSGQTNASLWLTNVQLAQSGDYSVTVFNSGGATSAVVRLAVYQPLVITAQPTNQFVRPGSATAFAVSAGGTGLLRYQWRRDGTDLPGAVGSSLTITNAQLANQGAYTVVVTHDYGSATSAPVSLVLLIDPIITLPPLSQQVVAGATVVLSVSVTNTANLPVGYRWRRNGIYLSGGSYCLNQRTCYFVITNAQPAYTNYSVVVTNLAKPTGLISATATLTFLSDTDNDGLPDSWTTAFFGSATGTDPGADPDGDGMSNWEEFVAGTNPTNAASSLQLDAHSTSGTLVVTLSAVSNRTYSVFYADGLEPNVWRKLADLPARPTNWTASLPDPAAATNRFYRVVVPAQP